MTPKTAAHHQIVHRRIPRPGVKGQKCAEQIRCDLLGVNPCQITDAAEVQEYCGPEQAHPTRAGPVIERGQRRALAANRYIGAAKVPNGVDAKRLGHPRAVTRLMGSVSFRIMREGLAVKTQKLHAL